MKKDAGRPRGALHIPAQAALEDMEVASNAGVADTQTLRWMHRDCGQHWRWQTIKAAQQSASSLHCKVCPGGQASLSQPALQAAHVLACTQHRWAYESRALRGKYGPLDFYFPSLKLAVEVDGELHYRGSMYGESHALQQQRDADKMAAAWRHGIRVLRVPYFAASSFHKSMDHAISECTLYPTHRFILWSTDPLHHYGALERRGDGCDAWLERLRKARESAQVWCTP